MAKENYEGERRMRILQNDESILAFDGFGIYGVSGSGTTMVDDRFHFGVVKLSGKNDQIFRRSREIVFLLASCVFSFFCMI